MRAEQDDMARAVQWAQILTAGIGLIGVPILIYQLYAARRQERAQRTREFQERYFTREFQSTASLTLSFLTVTDAADCVTKIQSWELRTHAEQKCLPRTPRRGATVPKAAVNDVQQVMNFFEDFATAYNRKHLVKGIVRDGFARTPVQVFTTAWWYICWRRDGQLMGENNTAAFAQFETMIKSLRSKNSSVKAAWTPNTSVRALCLPLGAATKRPESWKKSRRLSRAFSKHGERLPGLYERLRERYPTTGWEPSAAGKPHWQVLLIPTDIDVKPDEDWLSQRNHADRLSSWLSRFDEDHHVDKVIEELQRPD